MSPGARAILRCSLAATFLWAATPVCGHRQSGDPYAEAMAKYAAGNIGEAIAILEQTPPDTIRAAVNKGWRRQSAFTPQSLRAIRVTIMAHTETWLQRARSLPLGDVDIHFETARSLARALFNAADDQLPGTGPADRIFVRDWYLLIVSFLHGDMRVGSSRVYLAEAKKMFPRDAELLMAEGVGHEMLSGLTVATIQLYDSMGRATSVERVNEEKELRAAAAILTEAVAAHPGLIEAHLRLGRVLYRRGDMAGAARALEIARSASKHPEIRYLATVFLAIVSSSRGDLARGAALYREAIAMNPDAQAAFIGLSEVEYLSGRIKEASAVMSQVLTRVLKDDPWWSYQMGSWWHSEARLTALRAEVQQ